MDGYEEGSSIGRVGVGAYNVWLAVSSRPNGDNGQESISYRREEEEREVIEETD